MALCTNHQSQSWWDRIKGTLFSRDVNEDFPIKSWRTELRKRSPVRFRDVRCR
jgi:hypothetical protein